MTDYSDGNWHAWNGGECPVHPESEIDVVLQNSFGNLIRDTRLAFDHIWDTSGMNKAQTFAFRVTKAYVEPSKLFERWYLRADGFASEAVAQMFLDRLNAEYPEHDWLGHDVVHMIEVQK